MPSYSSSEKAKMIALRREALPWDEVAARLGRSPEACQRKARRMREEGEWPDDPDAPWELPDGPGRPRNRVRTKSVSVRFAPDIEDALRVVADSAGVRIGEVLGEAITRAVARHDGKRVEPHPFGLEPGSPETLCDAARLQTIAAYVPEVEFDRLAKLAADNGQPPTYAVALAARQLLADLNYQIVTCDDS